MNVIVAGATGGVGPEVVTQALAAGHHVTAYLRNPAKLAVTHSDFTVITGELTDRDAVRRAVHGADAIISALGPSLDRTVIWIAQGLLAVVLLMAGSMPGPPATSRPPPGSG